MKFVKQKTSLAESLAEAIGAALAQYDKVIWLVPGGSNIPISVAAMKLIDAGLSAKLTVMQTDERYVDADSPDCNWHQLIEAGLDTKRAKVYPVLAGPAAGLTETAERYSNVVATQFSQAKCTIGQFGVGANGHTAGIMPNSQATQSNALAVGYQAEDFARITLTFPAIMKLDQAFTFAYGVSKLPPLKQLKDNDLPLETLPAGILKRVRTSVLYNDQLEN